MKTMIEFAGLNVEEDKGNDNLFFVSREDIPDGVGFEHYDATHLTFLAGILLFIIAFAILYRRVGRVRSDRGTDSIASESPVAMVESPVAANEAPKQFAYLNAQNATQQKLRYLIAGLIVGMEIAKHLLCAFTGVYTWQILPLHLCGMSIFMIAIHTVHPTRFTAEFLYCLSIPGAISALLFADWTMYPVWNFFCLQSFLIHMLEITYPVMLLASGQMRPKLRNLWMPAIYIAIIAPIIYHLNHLLDTNFFFINEAAPGSPLSFLQSFLGSPGYVFGAAGLLVLIWLILYAPVEIGRKLHTLRTEKI
ncbi:MAG: TIGR02206 family membrane protein [Clostridiales Family XIII bacterium]|jgi:hypothetical integral membrane protein (TIGR02206 family)|nr:TIGR02206 family membrane protein [Clostridiales Family XIII bacterium]